MIVLATVSATNQIAVVLDLESGEQRVLASRPEFYDPAVVGRPGCRPFGITWNSEHLFIVNNRQLLTFDRTLRYVGLQSDSLQINTHQIAFNAGTVWVTSPWTNSLIGSSVDGRPNVEFDFMSQRMRPYERRDTNEANDATHVNSILWTARNLIIGIHNNGKSSFILRYGASSMRLEAMINDAGVATHGLALDGHGLHWISTGTQQIRSDQGDRLDLKRVGFARGLAVTEHYFVVALSQAKPRAERATGDAWIQVIDRRTRDVVAERQLEGTGEVNDLRLLDVFDYAHHVQPFWPAGTILTTLAATDVAS